jgi:membrane-associated phospholipid phosphatase
MQPARRPSARAALQGALLCAVALVLVGAGAAWSPQVHAIDADAASGFGAAAPTDLGMLTARIAQLCDPGPYLLIGVAIVVVALLRRRFARAGAVGVLLVVTGLTTQTLKSTLGHPRAGEILGVDMGSWPSGHSTAAMTLALCAVLVAPRVLRGAVAVAGAAFALSVGLGVLVMDWHYVTDVAGGYLVAMTWTLLAVAALRRVERPAPAAARTVSQAWGAVAVAVAAVVGAAAARVHTDSLATFALDHTWAALTAAGLCVMAVALAASLAATLRR